MKPDGPLTEEDPDDQDRRIARKRTGKPPVRPRTRAEGAPMQKPRIMFTLHDENREEIARLILEWKMPEAAVVRRLVKEALDRLRAERK